jgi:DNA invertase Pin-like site-specific DNA recombinase
MATIGYARVSTRGQDTALQEEQLRAAGCTKIFHEKMSGVRADRPQLRRMLKMVTAGDVVIVSRLDRLARSSRDLLNTIHELNQAGASFKSLSEQWCDTTTSHGRLILTVLGGLAEFERELIMSRTQAGIQKARDKGVQFGRKPRLSVSEKHKIAERFAKGETGAQLAEVYGVGIATIWRALRAREVAA